MAAVSVSDIPINIEISDSCNQCCCFGACKDKQRMYITHDYKAETFDHKKSKDHEADRRKCHERVNHLFRHLEENGIVCNFLIYTDDGKWITRHTIIEINETISKNLRK